MTEPRSPANPTKPGPAELEKPATSASVGPDEAGHASFPAGDPPAVWTWEEKKG